MTQDGPVKQSIRLGTYAGIPVGVHWSVAVIFGLVTWELADIVFPSAYGGTRATYWVAALVAAMLFFGSLLAHEVSHAVVARHHGVAVRSITLWLFGGVAQLGGEALTPGADFRIAAVGPGTSLLLVGAFAAVQALMNGAGVHGLAEAVPSWLWKMNLLLAAFNLIPAAPLDGGRILRAGLWLRSGDRTRSTVIAARVGRGFGIVLVVVGIAFFVGYNDVYGLWPAFLGWFLFVAARAEESAALVRRGLQDLRVENVMTAQPPAIASSTTVAELVHRHLPWYRTDAVAVVGPTGWLEGILPLERIRALPPLSHADTRIGDLAVPILAVPVARPEEPVQDLLQRMTAAGGAPAVVLDSHNRLAGIVTPANVDRAVQLSGLRAGGR
jgi:Zn-dependent protease